MEREFCIPVEQLDEFKNRVRCAVTYSANEKDYLETRYYGADVTLPYDDDVLSFTLYENIGALIDASHTSVFLHRMQQAKNDGHLLIGGNRGEYMPGRRYPFDPGQHLALLHPTEAIPHTGEPVVVTASQIATIINGKKEVLFPPVVSSPREGIAKEMAFHYSSDTPALSPYTDK